MFSPNPALTRSIETPTSRGTVTIGGVVNRTAMLVAFATIAFGVTWRGLQMEQFSPGLAMIGTLAGFVLAMIIIFTRSANPLLISGYAICEGIALGCVSYFAAQRYPGIAWQAVSGTFGCFFAVLALYRLQILRATPAFVKTICGVMLGIMIVYLADLVAGFFGHPFGLLHGNSNLSLGFSVVIIIVASLSFVIDFAQVESAVESGVSEEQSWRLAFGLVVGLVWLYLEILRLLLNSRSRN